MRFFVRSLSFGFLAILIAGIAGAQDLSTPVSLHPSSRPWLTDTAIVVIENDQPQTLDAVQQAIESVDGHLVLYAPPGVLIAQLPDEGMEAVSLTENVRLITKSPLDAAQAGITAQNAVLAVNYFNWVVSGHADAELDRPLAAEDAQPLLGDVVLPASSVGSQVSALIAGDHPTLGTTVLVNLVFLSGGTKVWNETDKNIAYNNTAAALSWWNSRILQHFGTARPSGMQFFTINSYPLSISTTPGENNTAASWANLAIGAACVGGCSWFDPTAASRGDAQTNVRNWNIATRGNYTDSFTGFLIHGDVTIDNGKIVGGYLQTIGAAWWAIGDNALGSPDPMAHETGHVYWACDEYVDADLDVHPTCSGCGGPRNPPNANADEPNGAGCVISDHKHSCIMKAKTGAFSVIGNDLNSEYLKVCPYTRMQINWWDKSCYADVNWDIGPTTHWEGAYFSDSHAPRMPLVHWAGAPELTRDDGSGNVLDFNFTTNPLTDACLTGSAGGTRTNDFSVRWRKVVNFDFGSYEFHGTGDDSVQIYVNGYQLKPSATPGVFEKIEIVGKSTVQVDYYQTSGSANVHVDWVKVVDPCGAGLFYGSLKPYQKTDYCPSESNVPHLQVFVVGGTAPYRVSVRRNNDLAVTYAVTAGVADIYPQGILGDSTYKLISVVDNNGCQGQIDSVADTVTVNIDSSTPRVVGKLRANQSSTSCSVSTSWDAANGCNGETISYTLTRFNNVSGGTPLPPVTLVNCMPQQFAYVDNDVHSGTFYTYSLTATLGTNCQTGTKRLYKEASVPVGCSATPSSIATSSITASFGEHPTLAAHLTGNGAPLPNRNVTFEVNGAPVGNGVTDASGNATTTTTVTLNAGTYPNALRVNYSGDDAWYAATATADVIVPPSCTPASITAQPANRTINLGGSTQLSIGTAGSAPVTVQWYTSAGASVGSGDSFTITPSWTNTYYAIVSNVCHSVQSATVKVTVRQPATITWPTPAAITYGTALSATQLNATANTPGVFTYTPAAGTVLGAGTRTLSVSFAPTDTANYLAATATQSLVVQKATPTGSWNPAPITYGTPLGAAQLNATATIPGTYVYTPPAGTILGAGTQTLSVTFTPTDSANYAITSGTVPLVVAKATPTVSWATPATITYGTPLSATQLNATASIAGIFVYTPGAGVILGAGARTLSVTFTPTDSANYNAVTSTASLTVDKATPTGSWTPAPLTYGTPLGAAQLNAAATIPGTYVYTPPAGTILGAGTQTLSCTFTPTNTADYLSNSGTVNVVVGKASQTIVWPAPAVIPSNTALSSAQLNATVSVVGPAAGGAITYDVAAGTVLSLGDHTLTATAAATSNYDSATRSIVIKVCDSPVITTQPVGANVAPGGSAHLTLQAAGTGPLTVTWYTGSGTLVGTGSPYVAVSTTTSYYAIVSNGCGSVLSNTITVAVCTAPTITAQPVGSSILAGQVATLSIGVAPLTTAQFEGGGLLFIRWYAASNNSLWGQGNNLAIYPIQTASYYAIVGNGCGTVRSADVTVTVTAPACSVPWIISRDPAGNIGIEGPGSVTLSVVAAVNDPEMHYQWYTGYDGVPVGTDSPSLDTGVLYPEGDGPYATVYKYWVVVYNHCGSVRSTDFNVIVAAGGGTIGEIE